MSISRIRNSSGRHSMALAFLFGTLCAATASAQQSSARNIFWSASDLVQVSENPAAKVNANTAQPAAPRKKPAQPAASHTAPHVDADLVARNGYGQQPLLVSVSNEQIGIRYALLLRDSIGHYAEVSPSTTFHNGDHLRLSVMANQPGFLYVIQQGSSGTWSPIFPNPAATSGNSNEIEQGHVYQVPSGKSFFRFDQHPGKEKLFLVLSRQRISDLDSTIKSLKEPAQPTSTTPDETAPQAPLLEAANHIPDAFVQSLASRDLSLADEQEVDEPQKGDQPGEKAVYVVSKVSYSKNESPRVVASVILHHE
jgi:hypothetical protein